MLSTRGNINWLMDKYNVTHEQLDEGLQFNKVSDKIKSKLVEIEKRMNNPQSYKLNPQQVQMLRDLSSRIAAAMPEYKSVEDAFAKKELTRTQAKQKLNQLNRKYSSVYNSLRKGSNLRLLKFAGLSVGALGSLLLMFRGGTFAFLGFSGVSAFSRKLVGEVKNITKNVTPKTKPEELQTDQNVDVVKMQKSIGQQ
jgi:hypothetical protein